MIASSPTHSRKICALRQLPTSSHDWKAGGRRLQQGAHPARRGTQCFGKQPFSQTSPSNTGLASLQPQTRERADLKIAQLHPVLNAASDGKAAHTHFQKEEGYCLYRLRWNGSHLWRPRAADAFWQKAAVIFQNPFPRAYPEARDQCWLPVPPTPPPKVLTKKRKNQMIKEPLCIYKPVNFARRFKALKNPKHLFEIFYTNWFCNTKKKTPEIKYLDFSEVRHSNSSRQECWRGGGNPIFKFDRNKFFLFLLIGRETRLHSYFCPWL